MTRLDDPTQTFNRPILLPEGPAGSCWIDGKAMGWFNCTPASFAMGIHATTGGNRRVSPCAVRKETGDTVGGTNLRQCADATLDLSGLAVQTYTGANVISPARVAQNVRAGRRVVVQGNADALLGTPQRSTGGAVNHAVLINEVRGGTLNEPSEALVYDPAADNRDAAWGHAADGPQWWPWSLVKKFMAYLRPTGENGARLGPGKCYAAVFPDSEPHYTRDVAHKGHISSPFPDRVRAAKSQVWIHSSPRRGVPTRKYPVQRGTLLVGYQYVHGDVYQGSDLWLGNDDATEFVHTKNLSHVGGTT